MKKQPQDRSRQQPGGERIHATAEHENRFTRPQVKV